MRLETDLDEKPKPRSLSKLGRWLRKPVGFWRAMEVLGLWVAAAVGVAAINSSNQELARASEPHARSVARYARSNADDEWAVK